MHDWRTRAYLQIAALELELGGPDMASDPELKRRRDMWSAIDRFAWPQYKEAQFGQLEAFTRAEAELTAYVVKSPPMRDLVLPPKPGAKPADGKPDAPAAPTPPTPPPAPSAPSDLPEPTPGFPDWRSRSLFQIGELAKAVGAKDDPEVRRRAALWFAIERFSWPQMKEQQFALVESFTRGEAELYRYLLQVPPAKAFLERKEEPKPVASASAGTSAAAEAKDAMASDPTQRFTKRVTKSGPPGVSSSVKSSPSGPDGPVVGEGSVIDIPPDVDPMGDMSPIEKYSGPPAQWCYTEGVKAWGEFAEHEYKDKKKARAAASKLRELMGFLDKNPESENQMKGLEQVVGLSCLEVINGVLDKRLR